MGWYRRRWVLNTAVVLGILLQVAVLVVGVEVGGNRNWIVLGPVQLQPSELSKPILILWMALMLARQGTFRRTAGGLFSPRFLAFCRWWALSCWAETWVPLSSTVSSLWDAVAGGYP
ncbi:cell division protein FtsW [Rothia aeria]|uniref:Probable peptidoglycan glycosyltransferase FtsW n=1 Tax=Rothia aeria TaxID=172042 RepID=A0A2Z5R3N7_9MICC|nr:cell division protein FtsW [Rothia aeria]